MLRYLVSLPQMAVSIYIISVLYFLLDNDLLLWFTSFQSNSTFLSGQGLQVQRKLRKKIY